MSFVKAPVGASIYDFGNGKSTFALTGHSSLLIRILSFARKTANAAGRGGYTVKYSHGVLQSDGTYANAYAELKFTTVPGMVANDRTAMVAAMLASINAATAANIAIDMMSTQVLPGATDIQV